MSKELQSYQQPEFDDPIRIRLNLNESRCALSHQSVQDSLRMDDLTNYPDMKSLTETIARSFDVPRDWIVVTAGGDQGIERVIRGSLVNQPDGQKSRNVVLRHSPSFKMIDIYTENNGGQLAAVDWLDGVFPVDEFVAAINDQTALVVLVSPNNPTGQVIELEAIKKVAAAAAEQGITCLVDLAYVEFADNDPTAELLELPNVVVVRTFSKAYGLAGLRVGFLMTAKPDLARQYLADAGPFPVSGLSLDLANQAMQEEERCQSTVEVIKVARSRLTECILKCGGKPLSSQGNFILAAFENADAIRNRLAKDGIAIRSFPDQPNLENFLRITCPTNASDEMHLFKALARATETNLEPERTSVLPTMDSDQGNVVSTTGSSSRKSEVFRKTKETDISILLNLDGTGKTEIETGIGFLDHMLTALAFHARFDLKLTCKGDLHIDDHHTAEDCALALGAAIDQALGERTGIVRFGYAYAPLDEALARTVIDLSGRPWPEVHLALEREMVGTIATENITHVFNSMAMALRCSLHVDVIRGTNDHHRAEAAFKSLALALRKSVTRSVGAVPSTKGVL